MKKIRFLFIIIIYNIHFLKSKAKWKAMRSNMLISYVKRLRSSIFPRHLNIYLKRKIYLFCNYTPAKHLILMIKLLNCLLLLQKQLT